MKKRYIIFIFILMIFLPSCRPEKKSEFIWLDEKSTIEIEKKIQENEEVLSISWCKAGKSYYLNLSQYYKYLWEYNKAINKLDNLMACFPVYKWVTSQNQLIMNNKWIIYETWWDDLKSQWKDSYKKKYQEAIKYYQKIIYLFKDSWFFTEEDKKIYNEKIQNILEKTE